MYSREVVIQDVLDFLIGGVTRGEKATRPEKVEWLLKKVFL